jgi:hypothetical protein
MANPTKIWNRGIISKHIIEKKQVLLLEVFLFFRNMAKQTLKRCISPKLSEAVKCEILTRVSFRKY